MSGKQAYVVKPATLSALLRQRPALRDMPSVAVRVIAGQVENA